MAELDYLRSELARAEADGISNAVLVPLPYIRRFIAVLEDRERLQTIKEAAWDVVDPLRPSAMGVELMRRIDALRAALEGRDG